MNATETTRTALERRRAPKTEATLFDLIERQTPAIEKALAGTIGAERFARVVTTEIKRNPKLLECDPTTVLGALMLAAQLQLEPGPLGHVYLVPFKRECQFVLGYTGMIELAYRSGRLKDVQAEIVYEADYFEWRKGSTPKLEHRPVLDPDARGARVAVYAVARLTTGGAPFVVLSPQEVAGFRARSAAAKAQQGPWQTDEDQMWRKTAVRRLRPWLPATALLARAAEVDESAARWEHGEVVPEIEEASDGE